MEYHSRHSSPRLDSTRLPRVIELAGNRIEQDEPTRGKIASGRGT